MLKFLFYMFFFGSRFLVIFYLFQLTRIILYFHFYYFLNNLCVILLC